MPATADLACEIGDRGLTVERSRGEVRTRLTTSGSMSAGGKVVREEEEGGGGKRKRRIHTAAVDAINHIVGRQRTSAAA